MHPSFESGLIDPMSTNFASHSYPLHHTHPILVHSQPSQRREAKSKRMYRQLSNPQLHSPSQERRTPQGEQVTPAYNLRPPEHAKEALVGTCTSTELIRTETLMVAYMTLKKKGRRREGGLGRGF